VSHRVHFVVPRWVDDPARPSGGNTYDLRLRAELTALGWDVRMVRAEGPDALGAALAGLPDGEVVLVDGLLASAAASATAAESQRLGLVVLLHMPMAEADPSTAGSEAEALRAAQAVITVSRWSRDWIVEHHNLPPERVVVTAPGADRGPLTNADPAGRRLLCVGPIVPEKGQDLLISALGRLAAASEGAGRAKRSERSERSDPGPHASQPPNQWTLTCAGALRLSPAFVSKLRTATEAAQIAGQITLTGPLTPDELDQVLGRTDLVISASRRESYGMSLTEALARGIPVLSTDVGGVREAIGEAPDGTVPGLLAPKDDADALAAHLERWLTDADLRTRLRNAAAERRERLRPWRDTATRVAEVLERAPLNRTAATSVVPGNGTTTT
jgi:glycosyltransferase involved in cell wall biosynthesis